MTQPQGAITESSSDLADRRVDLRGVPIRYIEAGTGHGGVPLLMLHGYNGSCDYWFPNTMPLLAVERHVIAPDLPGCGLSGKLPSHNLDAYSDFVADFLQALGIEQADVMGHSMGGQIAVAAAVKHPEHVRRLVLVDSAGLPELVKRPWMAPIQMLADSSLRQVSLYPMYIKIGLRARAAREGLKMVQTTSISRELKQLSTPTLIIWGSRDRVVPLEHGAFMARQIPRSRLVIIRGAGHMPFYEKPNQCARLILGFLRAGE